MLSIYRNRHATWYNWFAAWFELLDYLFSILTLGFYYPDLLKSSTHAKPVFLRQRYRSVGNRIKWWLIAWIRVLELLLVILTLCYFRFYWCDAFYLFVDKHFYKE